MKIDRLLTIIAVLWMAGILISGGSSPAFAAVSRLKLSALDATAGDHFGRSIAVSGDTAVVGADSDDDRGADSGSVYVFVRSSGGGWTQQAKLLANDGAAADNFGYVVAISGDTVVVGAPYNDNTKGNSGAAYIFTRSNGLWSQQAKLIIADAGENDYFGDAVAISGETVLVGAPYDNDKGANAGAAYVFTRSGTIWSQQAKLYAASASAADFFGDTVALSGETAAVGAEWSGTGESGFGSVCVFTRKNGAWTQQAELTAADNQAGDYFGLSVAISGDTLLASSYGTSLARSNIGAACVFTRLSGVWSQQAKLTLSDSTVDDRFGISTAISGDVAVVGAFKQDLPGAPDAGAAYAFKRVGGGVWIQKAQMTAGTAAASDWFGISVAVDGDTTLAGALQSDDGGSDAGSAWVFDLNVPLDTTPPEAPVVTSDSALTTDTTPIWTWTSGGGGIGLYRYLLNPAYNDAWTTTTSTAFTPVSALGKGPHTLFVQECDDAGNWSDSGSFTVTLAVGPNRPIVTSASDDTLDTTPTWTWTSGGGGGAWIFRYQLDGEKDGHWSGDVADATMTPLAALSSGRHTLYVQERDANGYWSFSGGFTVTVETDNAAAGWRAYR